MEQMMFQLVPKGRRGIGQQIAV